MTNEIAPMPAFSPGIRFSMIDLVVLIAGTLGTVILWTMTWWWGFIPAFVLSHFFLFCNVFRLSRPLELLWGGIFVMLASATIALDAPGWVATIVGSLCVTIIVIVIQLRKPSYHGIGWQSINPGLPAWWQARVAEIGKPSTEHPAT